jgi:eukaryotic-like serine/threonine-protein kinase
VNAEPALLTRIGKYEIVRVIGSGGGGVVYEAMHPELKKRVAVKTLHPKLAENPEATRRFLREGEAASRIRHPHVVDIADVGVHEGQPFLVMEYLEGRDLKAYLNARGPLSLTEAVDLMLPVIAAVGAGHDAGVVHRDLKPHNVFIASGRGVGAHPKVLDFGVSKLIDANPSSISWSGVEVMMGTLCYMAPEQVRGLRHLDARVDQYALGLILYECLTGTRVHAGDDQVAIIRNISEGAIQPPRNERPDLPPEFEAALMQALSTRPEDRFASVYDFGRALLPFAGERAALVWRAVFESLPSTQRRPIPPRATVLLDEPELPVEQRPRTATLPSASSPSPPRPRRRLLLLMALSLVPVLLGAGIAALVARRRAAPPAPEVAAPAPTPPPPRGTAIEPLPTRAPSSPPAAAAPPPAVAQEPPAPLPQLRPEANPAPPPPAAPPPAAAATDPAAPTPGAPAAAAVPAPVPERAPRRSAAKSRADTSYPVGANQAPIITD